MICVVISSLHPSSCTHRAGEADQLQGKVGYITIMYQLWLLYLTQVSISGTYHLYSVDIAQYSAYLLAMDIPQAAVDIIAQEWVDLPTAYHLARFVSDSCLQLELQLFTYKKIIGDSQTFPYSR